MLPVQAFMVLTFFLFFLSITLSRHFSFLLFLALLLSGCVQFGQTQQAGSDADLNFAINSVEKLQGMRSAWAKAEMIYF